MDTRSAGVTIDGIAMREGPLAPDSTRTVLVAGRAGVPATGVGAVVVNVTAVNQTLPTFVTVYAAGSSRPSTSNLNPTPGITAPNLVVAKLSADGRLDLYNSTGNVDLIVDVSGWFPAESSLQSIGPYRIMDSRLVGATDDSRAMRTGPIAANTTAKLQVTGRLGIPQSDVAAAILNVAAVNQTDITFLTVFPSGSPRPNASNLNPTPGIVAPNLVTVKVGPDGAVDIYNSSGSVDVIVDIVAWLPADNAFTAVEPARLLDTRSVGTTIDGVGAAGGAIAAGQTRNVKVTGRAEVPSSGVGAVVLNITAINQTKTTFVTAHPFSTSRPNSSNLNPTPFITSPNSVIVKVGADGFVALYNSVGTVDLIVDVAGWFPGDQLPSKAVNVASGSCVVTTAKIVKCWGFVNSVLDESVYDFIDIPGTDGAVAVAAGIAHGCALIEGGTVRCWGVGSRVVDGTALPSIARSAVPVVGPTNVIEISASGYHTCALTGAGAVWCRRFACAGCRCGRGRAYRVVDGIKLCVVGQRHGRLLGLLRRPGRRAEGPRWDQQRQRVPDE